MNADRNLPGTTSFISQHWLLVFLRGAVQRRLCTRIHCTTCGATEFRQGILAAFASASARPPSRRLDRESALVVAQAFGEVLVDHDEAMRLEAAARCLIFDIWNAAAGIEEVEVRLGDSWAGNVLRQMKEHERTLAEERRVLHAFQYPSAVRKRREEKKRAIQERHLERLAQKQERDRIWQLNHPKVD